MVATATQQWSARGKMSDKKDFGEWDECRVGGTTKFEDPRIGKFEYVEHKEQQSIADLVYRIQFRTRDGIEGQGLTEPIFRLESVRNWKT